MSWKVSESDYKFIEDEVKHYQFYKDELKRIVDDITHATPERDDNGGGKSNIPGRPTERAAIEIAMDRQINRMKRYINATEAAYNELDEEKKRFVRVIFWSGKKRMPTICEEFNISYETALRWKKAFLLKVGNLTGDKRKL